MDISDIEVRKENDIHIKTIILLYLNVYKIINHTYSEYIVTYKVYVTVMCTFVIHESDVKWMMGNLWIPEPKQ